MGKRPKSLFVAAGLGFVLCAAQVGIALWLVYADAMAALGGPPTIPHASDYILGLLAGAAMMLAGATLLLIGLSRWAYVIMALIQIVGCVWTLVTPATGQITYAIGFLIAASLAGIMLVNTRPTRTWFLDRRGNGIPPEG
jgi:hypothetical protein